EAGQPDGRHHPRLLPTGGDDRGSVRWIRDDDRCGEATRDRCVRMRAQRETRELREPPDRRGVEDRVIAIGLVIVATVALGFATHTQPARPLVLDLTNP